MRKYLIPCCNCAELVSKEYINNSGLCNICETSESTKNIRASHSNASSNQSFQSRLMNEWNID